MLHSNSSVRRLDLIAALSAAALLAACGGGGGGSSTTPTPTPTPSPSPTPTPSPSGIVSPMSCGAATSTGSGNSAPIVVDGFPCAVAGAAGQANVPQQLYVSVKVCQPGSTSNCQIIDHIILDTGSSGLRIAASALNASLKPGNTGLPLASGSLPNSILTECETYVSSYAYGPIVSADVYIAGESATNTKLQVFGDASFPVPSLCSQNGGTETDTVQAFGGNGLLGVSFAPIDNYTPYFDCGSTTAGSCSSNTVFAGIPNVVTQFASDNNGVAITLPSVGATGSNTPVSGTLNFGVSTQSNNTPGNSVLAIANDGTDSDQSYGTFYAQYPGGSWSAAYIDSGTDAVYFNDASLTVCASSSSFSNYYCPTSTQSIAFKYANYTAAGSPTAWNVVNLSVANPSYLTGNSIAFSNLAGPATSSSALASDIAFGLATFYGHTNYVLFSNATATTFGTSTSLAGPVNGIE